MSLWHYHTVRSDVKVDLDTILFDAIVAKYRDRFVHEVGGTRRVFGSLCVPTAKGWVVSPREKGEEFTSKDAVLVTDVCGDAVHVRGATKATLNAPLLVRMCQKYPKATAILHLHEQLPDVPIEPYAQPSTMHDGNRIIPGPVFNIEHHGFIACLDHNLDIWDLSSDPLRL
jgi:hypothetical protein